MVKAARASGRRGGGALCLGGFSTPARNPTAFSAWYVSETEAGTSVLSGSGGGGPIKTAQWLARDAKASAIEASAEEQELLAKLQELEQMQQKSGQCKARRLNAMQRQARLSQARCGKTK